MRQLRRRLGIRFQGAGDIDPVERMQVIEVNHVILHELRSRVKAILRRAAMAVPTADGEDDPAEESLTPACKVASRL